jgi:hypothetical protein
MFIANSTVLILNGGSVQVASLDSAALPKTTQDLVVTAAPPI